MMCHSDIFDLFSGRMLCRLFCSELFNLFFRGEFGQKLVFGLFQIFPGDNFLSGFTVKPMQ